MKRYGILMIIAITLGGCSAVTVRTDAAREAQRPPDFQKRFHYYFWGLKGEHSVNVREVCMGKKVEQMQAIDTLSDSLLEIITIGIYNPRTARVWCKETHK